MSPIEVAVEIEIAAAPADVAAVMFDPEREPEWLKEVTSVELIDKALMPGARVLHRGSVMGRDVSWTTEVEAVHFPHVLALKVQSGPFAGTLRYDIQRAGTGSRVRMRGVVDAPQLGLLPAGLVTGPVRSAFAGHLDRLKAVVERPRS